MRAWDGLRVEICLPSATRSVLVTGGGGVTAGCRRPNVYHTIDVQQDGRTEFEGERAFDSGATTTDLPTTLGEIKHDDEQQE